MLSGRNTYNLSSIRSFENINCDHIVFREHWPLISLLPAVDWKFGNRQQLVTFGTHTANKSTMWLLHKTKYFFHNHAFLYTIIGQEMRHKIYLWIAEWLSMHYGKWVLQKHNGRAILHMHSSLHDKGRLLCYQLQHCGPILPFQQWQMHRPTKACWLPRELYQHVEKRPLY